MAQAVKRLLPNVKLAIGPAIDEGFYYDFDVEKPFTDDLSNGTSACTLTINGTSYDTCADLFLYVNAYTN